MEFSQALVDLEKNGYLDIDVSEQSLVEEINRLRKQKKAVILAHYYQESEIQDVADFIGDSLELSRKAANTDADIIVFCGVHFMAETAKILSPFKKVLLPDLKAGCSLSDSCPPKQFAEFVAQHPDAVVISYINCSADIKALSDIICTSSNAEVMVNSVPKDKPIIFAPDKNLGRFLEQKTGRKMILWDGVCIVHEDFALEKTQALLRQHQDAQFIAHPESSENVLAIADFIGSTSQLLKYVASDSSNKYVVATESGIFHQMKKAAPQKTFITAECNNCVKTCVCGICPYMKRNTLAKLYICLEYELPEIDIQETTRIQALASLEQMLELSQSIY